MSDRTLTLNERADDYVLGLLDASDIAGLEADLETSADLRAAVAASRERFLELDLAGPTGLAPPSLWSRIEDALAA